VSELTKRVRASCDVGVRPSLATARELLDEYERLEAENEKLREENARLEELLNRAARIASELTGFPWPLPKPPEVKEDDEESRCLDQADMPGGFP